MPTEDSFTRLRAISRHLDETDALLEPEFVTRLLEALPDALLIINSAGTVLLVNSQCELLFGYPRAELLGRPIEQLLPERLHHLHEAHRTSFFLDPRRRPMGVSGQTLVGRHQSGVEIPLDINLSPIVTGRGIYVVAVIRKQRNG